MKGLFMFVVPALAAGLLASCQQCVTTTWGTKACLTPCKPLVRYQGNSFEIGETTIPISGGLVNIGGVKWDTKKLQEAAAIIQAMDNKRVRLCEERKADMQTLSYADYVEKDKQRQTMEEKLDQLAYLVALNNPQAVDKWIERYVANTADGPSGMGIRAARSRPTPESPAVSVRTFLR